MVYPIFPSLNFVDEIVFIGGNTIQIKLLFSNDECLFCNDNSCEDCQDAPSITAEGKIMDGRLGSSLCMVVGFENIRCCKNLLFRLNDGVVESINDNIKSYL